MFVLRRRQILEQHDLEFGPNDDSFIFKWTIPVGY